MKKIENEYNWSIETIRNSPSIDVTSSGITRDCRVLTQILVAPDGSKIQLEQHISNSDEYHDIILTKVQ